MTKTIEFIEKEIENSKKFLDRAIRYNLTICFKNETEKLQILEQIKCQLEAWEEMKKHEFEIDRLDSVAEYYVVHIWKPFKPEEIEKIKKASEAEKNE